MKSRSDQTRLSRCRSHGGAYASSCIVRSTSESPLLYTVLLFLVAFFFTYETYYYLIRCRRQYNRVISDICYTSFGGVKRRGMLLLCLRRTMNSRRKLRTMPRLITHSNFCRLAGRRRRLFRFSRLQLAAGTEDMMVGCGVNNNDSAYFQLWCACCIISKKVINRNVLKNEKKCI